jgi:hypothetical protein
MSIDGGDHGGATPRTGIVRRVLVRDPDEVPAARLVDAEDRRCEVGHLLFQISPSRAVSLTLAAPPGGQGTVSRPPASYPGCRTTNTKEGRIIDDLNDLAGLLGVTRRDLRSAIGVPWFRALPARYDYDFGPLFVGREGSAAAILCLGTNSELIGPGGVRTQAATRVVVGMASGRWRDDGRLGWMLDGDKSTLVRGVGVDPRAFLTSLKTATGRAVAQKAPSLVTCSVCDEVVGPEMRESEMVCRRCAAGDVGLASANLHLVAY